MQIGSIQKLIRLERVRHGLQEALNSISRVPTVLKVTSDEYSETQCVIQDWIESIEEQQYEIREELRNIVEAHNKANAADSEPAAKIIVE